MRVLICGSRDWDEVLPIWCVLNGYAHDDLSVTVISGMARGADTIAAGWASENGALLDPYPADWDAHGKAAGPIRNAEMLELGKPDVVWAFITKPLSQSRGTADMIRRVVAADVPTYVVNRP